MDNGSSDILSKLLSNPESIKALSEVAKGIMGNNQSSSLATLTQEIKEEMPQSKEVITKESVPLPSTPKKNSFDDRANLLYSIKPYLRKERHDKVDSLIKAINIAKIINTYTGENQNN